MNLRTGGMAQIQDSKMWVQTPVPPKKENKKTTKSH
jgi:hypothetical protein